LERDFFLTFAENSINMMKALLARISDFRSRMRAKYIARNLSVRLSLMVVLPTAVLLTVALLIMFLYARKTVRAEALQKAEQTLESTVQQIDNILLSVEQTAGNMYWLLLFNLSHPEKMAAYCENLVESNSFISGCAIAFKPYYYKEREELFMTYFYRGANPDSLISANSFGDTPYTEQEWYTQPMNTGRPCWTNPLSDKDALGRSLTTFCLPIYDMHMKPVGVLAVDVPVALISDVILSAKPSPNSYCTLLGSDGSYIVHPDRRKLSNMTIFSQFNENTDPTLREAAAAVMAGQTGNKHFRMSGNDYYIFYKPFMREAVNGRSMEDLKWNIGIIYPEDDIFGDYNRLTYYVIGIAVFGLILLLFLTQTMLHRQLVPLSLLTASAKRIAEGHFDEPVPDSHRNDEIGRLQVHFRQMQEALGIHVAELERLSDTLQQQGERLRETYTQAQEADRVKTSFLHHVTDQMQAPVGVINKDVHELCEHCRDLKPEEADRLVESLQTQSKTITELLDDLLNIAEGDRKKGGEA